MSVNTTINVKLFTLQFFSLVLFFLFLLYYLFIIIIKQFFFCFVFFFFFFSFYDICTRFECFSWLKFQAEKEKRDIIFFFFFSCLFCTSLQVFFIKFSHFFFFIHSPRGYFNWGISSNLISLIGLLLSFAWWFIK